MGKADRPVLAKLASKDPFVAAPAGQAFALGFLALFLPISTSVIFAQIIPGIQQFEGSTFTQVDSIMSLVGLLFGLGAFALGLQARRRRNGVVKRLIGSPVRVSTGVPLVEKSRIGYRVILEGRDFPMKKTDRAKITDGAKNTVSYLQDGKRLFVLAINGLLVHDLGGAKG